MDFIIVMMSSKIRKNDESLNQKKKTPTRVKVVAQEEKHYILSHDHVHTRIIRFF